MIELAVSWDDLDTIPDPCWVLTEDFGDTGELFGLKEEGEWCWRHGYWRGSQFGVDGI
jgi:hypothetical protein